MFTSLTKLTTLFKAKLKWWELGEHEIFKSSLLLHKLSSCRIHFSFKYTLKSLLLLSLSSCVLPCRHYTMLHFILFSLAVVSMNVCPHSFQNNFWKCPHCSYTRSILHKLPSCRIHFSLKCTLKSLLLLSLSSCVLPCRHYTMPHFMDF